MKTKPDVLGNAEQSAVGFWKLRLIFFMAVLFKGENPASVIS